MNPVLFYIVIGCIVAIIMVNNPRRIWGFMSRNEIIQDIIICSLFWPMFVAGMIYGIFKGRRK